MKRYAKKIILLFLQDNKENDWNVGCWAISLQPSVRTVSVTLSPRCLKFKLISLSLRWFTSLFNRINPTFESCFITAFKISSLCKKTLLIRKFSKSSFLFLIASSMIIERTETCLCFTDKSKTLIVSSELSDEEDDEDDERSGLMSAKIRSGYLAIIILTFSTSPFMIAVAKLFFHSVSSNWTKIKKLSLELIFSWLKYRVSPQKIVQ